MQGLLHARKAVIGEHTSFNDGSKLRGLSSFKIAPIAAVLPTENGFVGHTELFSEPLLRHAIFFSQAGNEFFVFRLNHFASPEEKDSVFFVKMLPHKQQILLDKLEVIVLKQIELLLHFHLFQLTQYQIRTFQYKT